MEEVGVSRKSIRTTQMLTNNVATDDDVTDMEETFEVDSVAVTDIEEPVAKPVLTIPTFVLKRSQQIAP